MRDRLSWHFYMAEAPEANAATPDTADHEPPQRWKVNPTGVSPSFMLSTTYENISFDYSAWRNACQND
jgi:hypothetical protein